MKYDNIKMEGYLSKKNGEKIEDKEMEDFINKFLDFIEEDCGILYSGLWKGEIDEVNYSG